MFMATNAQMGMVKDVSGLNTFALNFPVTGMLYSCTLPASSAVTLTVPQFDNFTRYVMIISYEPGSTVWVSCNGTATGPAGTTFAVCASELNPGSREVRTGDIISFYTADLTAQVGVTFRALQQV
jgi:hypothetical protein